MCVCLVRFGLWLYNGQLLLALCPAAYNLWERETVLSCSTGNDPSSLCSPLTVRMRRPDAFVYTLTIANRGRTAAESDQVRKIVRTDWWLSREDLVSLCPADGRTDGWRKSTCVVLNLLLRRPKVAPATEEMKRATLCLLQRWTNGNNFPHLRPSIPVAFDSTAAATPRPVLRRRRCCCSFPPLGYSIIEPILRCT